MRYINLRFTYLLTYLNMVATVKGSVMTHLHHCLVTQKLQSTYFNVLYAYFIIGPNVRSHYARIERQRPSPDKPHDDDSNSNSNVTKAWKPLTSYYKRYNTIGLHYKTTNTYFVYTVKK